MRFHFDLHRVLVRLEGMKADDFEQEFVEVIVTTRTGGAHVFGARRVRGKCNAGIMQKLRHLRGTTRNPWHPHHGLLCRFPLWNRRITHVLSVPNPTLHPTAGNVLL